MNITPRRQANPEQDNHAQDRPFLLSGTPSGRHVPKRISYTLSDLLDLLYRRTLIARTHELNEAFFVAHQQCTSREEMARADMQLWQRVETRAAIHQITICSQFDEAREELRCFLASHRAGPAPYGMNALDWHDVTMAWADAEIQCMLQRGYLFAVHVVIEAATYYQWKRGDFEHLERAEPIPGTVPDEVGLIKRGFVPEGGVRMPDGSYVSRGGKGSTFEGKKVSGPSDKAWDTDEARKGRNKWSEEEKAALAAKGSSPRKIAGQNTFYATKVIPNDLFWARVDDHCLQKAAAGKQHKLPTKATVPLILNTSVWKTSTPLRKDAQAKAVEADDGETEKVVGRDIDVDGQADEQG